MLFYVNRPGEPGIVLWEVAIAALCFEVLYRSFGVLFRVLAARQGVALDRSAGQISRATATRTPSASSTLL